MKIEIENDNAAWLSHLSKNGYFICIRVYEDTVFLSVTDPEKRKRYLHASGTYFKIE